MRRKKISFLTVSLFTFCFFTNKVSNLFFRTELTVLSQTQENKIVDDCGSKLFLVMSAEYREEDFVKVILIIMTKL